MSVHISEKGIRLLLLKLSPGGPVVEENSKIFLCHDALELHNNPKPYEGLRIDFMWKGEVLATMNAYGVRLENDCSLCLQNLKLRQEITIRSG